MPVLSPYLSSLWLVLVTPASFEIGRHLIEGLKNPTVVRDRSALDVFAIRPMNMRDAVAKALDAKLNHESHKLMVGETRHQSTDIEKRLGLAF